MIRALLTVGLMSLLAQPAQAATFGLVVGIDAYDAEASLKGAVQDALDIKQALTTFGAERIVTLLDREATRAAIETAYNELLAGAQPGDTVVFSYAGHGSQSPARIPEEEADGLDEFFLLSSFDRTKPETLGEMILDDEIRAWIQRADDKDVKVVLVADSCHSGGMQRSLQTTFRYAPAFESTLGLDSPDATAGSVITEEQLRSAMFFSASLESQLAPEINISGTPRGALSFAFSRALESDVADHNKDGRLSRGELERYVVEIVESHAESAQTPVIRPRDVALIEETVFTFRSIEPPDPQPEPNVYPEVPDVAFSVSNGGPVQVAGTIEGEGGYRWDAATLQFYSPLGEVVASCITAGQLQSVIDKARILELLKRESVSGTGEIAIEPGKELYFEGDRVELSAPAWPESAAVVFNLASTGEVQFVAEAQGKPGDNLEIGRSSVIKPFGGDHLIVMSLGAKTPSLALTLQRRPAPTTTELLGALPLLMAGQTIRVAIQPLYTAGGAQRVAAGGQPQPQEAPKCS